MFPSIEIFGREIGLYGILAMIGIGAAALLCRLLYKQRGMNPYDILLCAVIALIGAFFGAHLLYGVTKFSALLEILKDPHISELPFRGWIDLFVLVFGGWVFYGGLLGGIAGGAIYCRAAKQPLGEYADLFACAVPLFHAFGRIGCFFGGCCYGVESSFGVMMHHAPSPGANGVTRFPVQLLESLALFILAAIMTYAFCHAYKRGRLFRIYLETYAVIRFADEFLRGDTYRGFLGPFSTSQWISIAILIACLIWQLFDQPKKQPAMTGAIPAEPEKNQTCTDNGGQTIDHAEEE